MLLQLIHSQHFTYHPLLRWKSNYTFNPPSSNLHTLHTSFHFYNSAQSFVRHSNARQNHTVDTALYTELPKTIANLSLKTLNPESTSKIGVEILLLLQANISMSKSPNDVDILYKN